jgi:hypothetical protein
VTVLGPRLPCAAGPVWQAGCGRRGKSVLPA